jgi:hypothetical protein
LGFCRLVDDKSIDEIIPTYEEVVRELEDQTGAKAPLGVSSSWFSDTFILFSRYGTDREFAAVEQAGRLFFQKLLLKDVPLRGALTFGKLYSRVDRNIFIGPALIDAYHYAEAQDWIGLILTPTAYRRCRSTVLDLDNRAHYRRVEAEAVVRKFPREDVYAFAFNNASIGGRNPYLEHIRAMRATAPTECRHKYDNTEAFLLLHSREFGEVSTSA